MILILCGYYLFLAVLLVTGAALWSEIQVALAVNCKWHPAATTWTYNGDGLCSSTSSLTGTYNSGCNGCKVEISVTWQTRSSIESYTVNADGAPLMTITTQGSGNSTVNHTHPCPQGSGYTCMLTVVEDCSGLNPQTLSFDSEFSSDDCPP